MSAVHASFLGSAVVAPGKAGARVRARRAVVKVRARRFEDDRSRFLPTPIARAVRSKRFPFPRALASDAVAHHRLMIPVRSARQAAASSKDDAALPKTVLASATAASILLSAPIALAADPTACGSPERAGYLKCMRA
jgi:hypothetical protein